MTLEILVPHRILSGGLGCWEVVWPQIQQPSATLKACKSRPGQRSTVGGSGHSYYWAVAPQRVKMPFSGWKRLVLGCFLLQIIKDLAKKMT